MEARVLDYTCPYCGARLVDDQWTWDHIIPADIGGPGRLRLLSCKPCNQRIGREIEQPAMQSGQIRNLLGRRISEGYKIRGRRRRRAIPMYKEMGVAAGTMAKFYWHVEKKELELVFPAGLPREGFGSRVLEHGGVVIFPEDYDIKEQTIALVRLATKILLGICCFIWGKDFIKGETAVELRRRMWGTDFESVLEIGEDDFHLRLAEPRPGKEEDYVFLDEDALNNTPHHTVAFVRSDLGFVGVVNLFGDYESMNWIVGDHCLDRLGQESGMVVLAKSTENSFKIMTMSEYEKSKSGKTPRRIRRIG